MKANCRNMGIGKRLFGELGQIAKDRGCKRVEWRVLKVCGQSERIIVWQYLTTAYQWNEPSIAFYTQCLKADDLSEWDTMRIEGDEKIQRLITDFRKP